MIRKVGRVLNNSDVTGKGRKERGKERKRDRVTDTKRILLSFQ